MAKVLLTVTFRTHAEFPAEQTALAAVQQIIDPVQLGRLEQEPDHPDCFRYSIHCHIVLAADQPQVNLNAINARAWLCADGIVRALADAGIKDAHVIAAAGIVVQPVSEARLEFGDEAPEPSPCQRCHDFDLAIFLLRRLTSMILSPPAPGALASQEDRGYDGNLIEVAQEAVLFLAAHIKVGGL